MSCLLTHSVERYYYKKLCYRDATCQSKSCRLLRNGVGTICTTSAEEIEVMELEGYSRPTYDELVHSAMTRSTVAHVIHMLSADEFVCDHTSTPTCCGDEKSSLKGAWSGSGDPFRILHPV